MSFATHTHFGGPQHYSKYEAEGFRPFEKQRRRPGALLTSLAAAAVLSVASGAIVLNRLDHLPAVNTQDAVGPITEYTTLQWQEDAARKSGVVRGRLSVLTPPVYKNQPVFSVATAPAAEKVEAEVTGSEAAELAAYLDTYPSARAAAVRDAQAATSTQAVAADIAAADAMAEADQQSGPEPRYILDDDVAPPAQIMPDNARTTIGDDNTVSM